MLRALKVLLLGHRCGMCLVLHNTYKVHSDVDVVFSCNMRGLNRAASMCIGLSLGTMLFFEVVGNIGVVVTGCRVNPIPKRFS